MQGSALANLPSGSREPAQRQKGSSPCDGVKHMLDVQALQVLHDFCIARAHSLDASLTAPTKMLQRQDTERLFLQMRDNQSNKVLWLVP